MIQCFVKREFVSVFQNSSPKLRYVSRINATYKYPRIMHGHQDLLELLFVRSGTGVYIMNEVRYPIRQGDMIICNSGVLHDEAPECNSELNTYCCAVSGLELEGIRKNCLIADDIYPVVPCNDQAAEIEQIMGMLYAELAANQDGSEECCHYLMLALLRKVLRLVEENKTFHDKKQDEIYLKGAMIKAYIDSRYDQDLSLQSIGRAINISPYYLAHIFKRTIGYSPMQYITRRRIGEAQTLLIGTCYSITQIASIVGYDNVSHFNTMFLKYIGMSPRQYRTTYINVQREKL